MDCTDCGGVATFLVSWSPTELDVGSCSEHLATVSSDHIDKRLKQRPQDKILFVTVRRATDG